MASSIQMAIHREEVLFRGWNIAESGEQIYVEGAMTLGHGLDIVPKFVWVNARRPFPGGDQCSLSSLWNNSDYKGNSSRLGLLSHVRGQRIKFLPAGLPGSWGARAKKSRRIFLHQVVLHVLPLTLVEKVLQREHGFGLGEIFDDMPPFISYQNVDWLPVIGIQDMLPSTA